MIVERFALIGVLLIGGCAGLSQVEERVPEETVRRFVQQELATQPFFIDQGTLDPDMTGEPERKWMIDFYYEKRTVAPDICLATQLRLITAKRQTAYEIERRETTTLIALKGCAGTDERDFTLVLGELSDQEIKRAVTDALKFARAGMAADPGTVVCSPAHLREFVRLVDPARLFIFGRNGNGTWLSFVIPGTQSLLYIELMYRGDELSRISLRAEELDVRPRRPPSALELKLFQDGPVECRPDVGQAG